MTDYLSFLKMIKFDIPDLIDFIKDQSCLICGMVPVDPHHVKTRGAGGDDYCNVVPLCRRHHQEIHDTGRVTFANKYNIQLEKLATKYFKRFKQTKEGQRWTQNNEIPIHLYTSNSVEQ